MPSFTPTYDWIQVIEFARNLGAKKVQVGNYDVKIAQMVQSAMYDHRLWQFSLKSIPYGSMTLNQGQQDYPAPSDIYRLNRAWVTITYPNSDGSAFNPAVPGMGGSPDQNWELDVVANLTQDLNPTGFYGNGSACYLKQYSVIRLQNAVQNWNQPPNPAYLGLEYQPAIPKITSCDMPLCFPDRYFQAAVEGALYWLYKFGDNDRAGTATKQGNTVQYSGQLGKFKSELDIIAADEEGANVSTFFPSDSIGFTWWGERAPLGPGWGF
jgi:hypothetical protein